MESLKSSSVSQWCLVITTSWCSILPIKILNTLYGHCLRSLANSIDFFINFCMLFFFVTYHICMYLTLVELDKVKYAFCISTCTYRTTGNKTLPLSHSINHHKEVEMEGGTGKRSKRAAYCSIMRKCLAVSRNLPRTSFFTTYVDVVIGAMNVYVCITILLNKNMCVCVHMKYV